MDNRATKFEKACLGFCIIILCFLALSILIRFLTREILIERLHWDNEFTRVVWLDNSEVGGSGCIEEGSEIFVDINWEKLYPFKNIENNNMVIRNRSKVSFLISLIYGIEDKISSNLNDFLIGYNREVQIAKGFNAFLGVDKLSNNSDILYLDNGYLTYYEPLVGEDDINDIADNVADFAQFLNNRDVDFLYVNAGSKVCPYDKQTMYVDSEYTNENGDALMHALSDRKVNYLDMRDEMVGDGLDWYASYYKTDPHWKTETALWAAKKLAEHLNAEFGYNFDILKFEPSAYDMVTTEDFWFGGQGRTVTFVNADLESYTKIIPKFETDFHIEIPARSVSNDGDYEETLFNNDLYNSIFEYSKDDHLTKPSAYNSVTWRNDPLGTIRNNYKNSNDGMKILFLQDSFSWYLSTYIACDIEAVDLIHPAFFTGSIRSYIEETKPDMVIMIMCERNISPVYGLTHKEVFELR